MNEYDGIQEILTELTRGSMSERVLEAIRIAIINHTFKAGDRLVEARLAKAMGVSITPVRYAFTQLSKEGLIDIYPYRGTYVKSLSKKFVREVCALRAILEREAAGAAFDNFTPEDLNALNHQIKLLSRSLSSFRYPYEACRADTRFHDLIFQRSGNDTLVEFWEMLRVRMEYITSYTKLRTSPALQKERHMRLMADIAAHDKEKFVQDIYDHCIHPNLEFFNE